MKKWKLVPIDTVPYTPLEIALVIALSACNGMLLGAILVYAMQR